MITQKEYVLMKILNCGSYDLSLLERIDYDLYEIIDELTAMNNLNLNSILREVFIKGAYEFYKEFEEHKGEIQEQIEEKIELCKDDTQKSGFVLFRIVAQRKIEPFGGLGLFS